MRISNVFSQVAFLFCLLLAFSRVSGQPSVMQARIHLTEKAQTPQIIDLQLDVAYLKYGQYIDIVTDREEVDRLRSWGYDVQIVHQDLVAFYQSRLDSTKDMGGYHTYSEVMTALDSMHTLHPSITTEKMDIGRSLEDSVIWAFKISDNPEADEDEPEVFYNSLIHAREPAGMEVLLYFMWYLLDNYGADPQVTHLVDDRELWFVPVVNVDGYCYNEYTYPGGGGMWRKNRRPCDGDSGVDLNCNWGYMWGYDDIGSNPNCAHLSYRGSEPFSEPATQVIRDFMLTRNFVMCMNNHTYGEWLLYPWGYEYLYTSDHQLFVAIAESMAVFNGYTPSTVWEAMYVPCNGNAFDWQYAELGIIAIAPEIGNQIDGFWPPAPRIDSLCQSQLQSNLLWAELADNPSKVLPPYAPTLAPIDSDTSDYDVFWSHADTLNPASVYELVEMTGLERSTFDVESGYSDWKLEGFSVSAARSHSASHSFYSGQGNRLRNKATSLSSIKVQPGDTLMMWCWYSMAAGWDYAYVEISTNGGGSFFPIPGNITRESNPNHLNQGHGITGLSAGWVLGKFDLGDYVGQEIYLRLRYVTPQYSSREGLYADDIHPFERYTSMVSLSDAIADTFYQITGQEEGAYDYKVRAKDQQDQWGAWSNVETALVPPEFPRGDANGDGFINVADIVYLVNFLYRSGDIPDPVEAADANCDDVVNVADIVYLVNYLYRGGDPPGCP
ncbi:MAG: immune inhibitor A [Candidatus Zixiibacteriota bacterium]|nr:MAG: immune inhibitor A [candidate division Zixibacteria bacterium]